MGRIMIWVLMFFSKTLLFSQTNFLEIKNLNQKLPSYKINPPTEKIKLSEKNKSSTRPYRSIKIEEIKKSGTHLGAVRKGSILHNLKSNDQKIVPKDIYIRVFDLEDESGFKYIQNEDGSVTWKMAGRMVESLKEDLKMYEAPEIYTPAPSITNSYYDKGLFISPELIFYSGIIDGNYIQDLFNDKNASSGVANQFGLHVFTRWAAPLKAGAVVHFEKAHYLTGSGGGVDYTSLSVGPQLKTKDFTSIIPFRFQAQFRFGPFASAQSDEQSFKFYSNDLMASIEMPYKNFLGEFIIGIYYQKQWLNLKDQTSQIDLESEGKTNNSYGLSIAQVFE